MKNNLTEKTEVNHNDFFLLLNDNAHTILSISLADIKKIFMEIGKDLINPIHNITICYKKSEYDVISYNSFKNLLIDYGALMNYIGQAYIHYSDFLTEEEMKILEKEEILENLE